METYGENDDAKMAFTMLMKTIPSDIRNDILRKEELQRMAIPELVEYIKNQSTWIRSEVLVQQMLKDNDHTAPIAAMGPRAPPAGPSLAKTEAVNTLGVPVDAIDKLTRAVFH